MTRTLRPYQSAVKDGVSSQWRAGLKRGLVVSPTGSGKGTLLMGTAALAIARGCRVFAVAHRQEIQDQLAAEAYAWGLSPSFVVNGRGYNPFAMLQICSNISLANRLKSGRMKPADLCLVDEAHHAAAGTSWGRIIEAHEGKYVLGFTATPWRLSGEPLSAFEFMVLGPTTGELISMGALSDYKAFAPKTPDMAGVHSRAGDFVQAENEALMDRGTITGDAVNEYRRHCMGKRAVAFCTSIAHAHHVSASFLASGVSAEHIDGNMPRHERRAVLDRFRRGETLVLTACDTISEGTDIPAIESVILLRPTQSLSLYLQQVGRALRPFEGKRHAFILDHAGNIARHGLPDSEREWSLQGRDRRSRGDNSEPSIQTCMCPSCFFVSKGTFIACPSCGESRTVEGRKIEEVAGELVEISEAEREFVRRQQQRERKDEEREAKSLEALIALARKRGYKNPNAWASMRMHFREAAKRGTYPHGKRAARG